MACIRRRFAGLEPPRSPPERQPASRGAPDAAHFDTDTVYYANNRTFLQTEDNVAVSIIDLLRQSARPAMAKGTVLTPMAYVHVRWPWVFYATAFSLLAILFLVLTMIRSHGAGGAMWKSSSLALAFHAYRSVDDRESSITGARGTNKVARTTRVRMTTDEDGRLALRGS